MRGPSSRFRLVKRGRVRYWRALRFLVLHSRTLLVARVRLRWPVAGAFAKGTIMDEQSEGARALFFDESSVESAAAASGFAIESVEPLPEIDGDAIVMRHGKSGARLLFLRNADENKAFSIAFKTPPVDDTGVFHILEHSVLCGSDKFPVKEPFVNLLKTSMQTFLNALTFPDKTMYPVASTNDQDLENLTDVYMDAVLHPAIYGKREVFEQEGWHYELDDAPEDGSAEERLRYNGVVFNEMKGALSDPESVLYRSMNTALFPGTCYACESGGDPRCIPQLTYEGYLDTHARHYRLDNSYIVLYGDIDAPRMLGFLDRRYLSADDCAPRTSAAPNPMGECAPTVSLDGSIPMATAPENACIGLGYVVGPARDFERVLAVDVLMDALMGGNESPIKRAVLDAGIGGDATAFLMDSQAMPVALFELKGAKPAVKRRFMEIVETEAACLVKEGIPRDVLEASLAQLSFELRERDRGMADGVVLAMNALSGWLYGDDMATTYLRYEEALAHMRDGLDSGYFERVLDELIVKSSHKALLEILPSEDDGESEESQELAEKLATLDEASKQAIRDDVTALRAMQEAPDSPEALASLPRLTVADIGAAKPDPAAEFDASLPLPCLRHELPSRHINYLYLYFDANDVAFDDAPYLTVLCMLLNKLDTANHTAAELDVLMRRHLGSMRFFPDSYAAADDPDRVSLRVTLSASATAEEASWLADIPREVWESTRFDAKQKILDVLVQRRIGMEQAFANEGHTSAASRLSASYFRAGVLRQKLGGVDFYLFLKDLIEHYDERFDGLVAKLQAVRAAVFGAPALASFTGSTEECDAFWAGAGNMGLARDERAVAGDVLPREGCSLSIPEPQVRCEAFIVPCDVSYSAKGAPTLDVAPHSGVWSVIANALSFDYLWNEVRVKGGAYGVGFRRGEEGFARFYSYRDPGIDGTLARFDAATDWLAGFDPDGAEMEGYIVATVAAHDAPAKPRAIARREDGAFLCGRGADWREKLRDEKLAATPDAIRACAPVLRKVTDEGVVCVFGNEDIIRAAKHPLEIVKLF